MLVGQPEGAEGAKRQRDLSTGDLAFTGEFIEGLGRVLDLTRALQDAVYRQVQGLLRP